VYNVLYFTDHIISLKEETQNLATEMFPSGFFVIHYSTTCCQHHIPKTTGLVTSIGNIMHI